MLRYVEKHCFQNDIAWSLGFAKRRDLIGGSIPTRDTIIPEGPEVPTERNKRQVSEGFAYFGFWPGVPVHKGITIVISLFRSHWLAIVYCLVFCIGSCEPVHEDRTH